MVATVTWQEKGDTLPPTIAILNDDLQWTCSESHTADMLNIVYEAKGSSGPADGMPGFVAVTELAASLEAEGYQVTIEWGEEEDEEPNPDGEQIVY